MKLDVLAIGVHPDDIELSCSGTLLGLIAQGKKVGICDLTTGQLGTRGTPEIRLQEAEDAKDIMGALVRDNLGMEDGYFRNTVENQKKIIEVVRKYRPDVVLANAPSDRHPDHGRASTLISEACFYSGLVKIDTDQDAWRPKALYYYIQEKNLTPDFVVDISAHIDKKMEVIKAFKTQFFNPQSKENNTAISSKIFLDFMEAKARVFGRPAGFEFAEGFISNRTIGVTDLMDLK